MTDGRQWWRDGDQIVRPSVDEFSARGIVLSEEGEVVWSCSHRHRTLLAAFRCAYRNLVDEGASKMNLEANR